MIITKTYLAGLVEKGQNLKEIRATILESYGKAPTFKQLKSFLDEAKLVIATKPRKMTFEFFNDVDGDDTPEEEEEAFPEEEENSFLSEFQTVETERVVTNY